MEYDLWYEFICIEILFCVLIHSINLKCVVADMYLFIYLFIIFFIKRLIHREFSRGGGGRKHF